MFNIIISNRMKRFFALIICLLMSVCFMITNGNAENDLFDGKKKIVVLDPGHGGHDKGAEGADGAFEKAITLSLARMIATELGSKYRAVLTRADDYLLGIPDRTAVANHRGADLFISIHVGGSFLHKASGITVYYFKEMSESDITFKGATSKTYNSDNDLTTWDNIQKRHVTRSKALAKSMQTQINDRIKHMETRIEGAPLVVLSGADMPAILIEIGYISNPGEEKKLRDTQILSEFAKAISKAIDNFLSEKN
ncbi:MAG: N-acetylmuramoyl-L-alanine amidase [Desulfobacteraceae bacterium]|uniref:N-acetylmuramoyl-L-alanine amidase n=1 Tax=Candidatus Desulfaltia bathyphila TaxID=2841697 RepID=A0A8J6N2Q6_9BACT|nr:N-acetylmuramoyl-L-alanine amidase [Candidatus Desulfaltia bathyphila]